MNLLEKMKSYIYRPAFFAERPFRFRPALRFYAILVLVFVGLQILVTLPGTVQFFRTVFSENWQKQRAIVQSIFPAELVLTVTDGAVSTNVAEPYALPVPTAWQSPRSDMPENLVVINTKKPIETGDFSKENTAFIISEHGFGYHDFKKGEFRIYDTRDTQWRETFSADKTGYDALIAKVFHYLRIALIIGVVILPFLLYGMFFVGLLIYLIFGALLVFLAAKIKNWPLSYGQAYVAAIYLLPVPLLYDVFLTAMPRWYHGAPFAFSFLLFIMALLQFPKGTSLSVPIVASATPADSKTEAKPTE